MNKLEVKTVEDLHKYYNSCRKIKFNDDVKPESIDHIYRMIAIKYDSIETFYMNGNIHCKIKKYRSIHDYILLCKYYFPETGLIDIMKIIQKYITNAMDDSYYTHIIYCTDIKKDNFRASFYPSLGHLDYFTNHMSFKRQGFPNCDVKYMAV